MTLGQGLWGKNGGMTKPVSYKRHRFSPEIIAHTVWLYFRFPLSLRLVEEMLLERGIVVSYETVRRWGKKFGPEYARRLCRKRPSHYDVWHLDEVVISIAGKKRRLWLQRAVTSCRTASATEPRSDRAACNQGSVLSGRHVNTRGKLPDDRRCGT